MVGDQRDRVGGHIDQILFRLSQLAESSGWRPHRSNPVQTITTGREFGLAATSIKSCTDYHNWQRVRVGREAGREIDGPRSMEGS
jgi:hypothetical protein